ncbi:MAG: DUF4248 domain-containing protein [Bacteroidales bacterium]|nr:DUF4248 domain-containing protein [Bacteroidales bacterium]
MQEFQIRSYGLTELAQLYRPNILPKSAARTLRNWIRRNHELQDELAASGFNPDSSRVLTPLQVSIIVSYLGEP